VKLILFFLAALTLSVATTISVWNNHRTENVAQFEFLFDSEICALPCFIGVMPGETTYTEAIRLLRAIVPKDHFVDEAGFWLDREDGSRINGRLNTTISAGDYIGSIELSTWGEGQITSLGDMLDADYEPVKVFRHRSNGPNTVNLLVIFGNDMQIAANVIGTQKLDRNSPIEYMVLFGYQDRKFRLTDLRVIQHYDYEISWLGFVSVENYLDA
jgi:hypothetical protein